MKAIRPAVVLWVVLVLFAQVNWTVAGEESSTPGERSKTIEFTGRLRTGIAAIGGETTGTVISANGKTYELDVGNDPRLQGLAEKLNEKDVVVKGTLERKRGVEIRERWIITVTNLRPAVKGGNGEVVIEDNITYGKADDTELKLDLARPQGDGPFPAIMFIHGGGWSGGNRQGYLGQIHEAARRGYFAATISYRLMKFDESKKETTTATPIFPAQIHDAKAAIRWVRANAKKYHVNADRIGVTGGSAGGHLSLLVGLTDPASNLEGESGNPDQSSRVQAVVNVFGPTDMAFCYEKSSVAWIFRLFMGGTPSEAAERYEAASPLTYVSKDDPPVLTLHGDQDALVPVEQARVLDEKMKTAGANHTLMVFEGQGHGFGGESGKKAADATWDFFDQHLKP